MADPALKEPYDVPGHEPSKVPGSGHLKSIEGQGDSSPPNRDWYKNTPQPEDLPGLEKEGSDKPGRHLSLIPGGKDDSQVGKGHTGAGEQARSIRGLLKSRKNKAVAGLVMLGATIAVSLAIFLALLPFKILHIVQNLENHFYASSEQAVGNESEKLLSNYLTQKVLPTISDGRCTDMKVSRNCAETSTGNNPVSHLYNTWKTARLENKLANNYGIEFYKSGGKLYLRAPGIDNFPADSFLNKDGNIFAEVNRRDFRRLTREALKDQTKWHRIIYYYKVGPLIERKYGVRRCIAAKPCGLLDKTVDKVAEKKLLFKAWLTERVLEPRSEMLSLAVTCAVFDTNSCRTNILQNTEDGPDHEKMSSFERDLYGKLADFRAKYGERKLEDLLKVSEDIKNKGMTKYMVEKIFAQMFGEGAGQASGKAVPIIGWMQFLSSLLSSANEMGPALKKMGYVINAASMVQVYTMYRTYADEMKAGSPNINPAISGAFTNSLGPNAKNDGSGSDATGTPLYTDLMGGATDSSSSVVENILSSKTYAASQTKSTKYVCNDNNPVPAGKLVCPEENLGKESSAVAILNNVHDFLNSFPGGAFILKLAGYLNTFFTTIVNLLGTVLCSITPVCSLFEQVFGSAIKPLIELLTSQLIPSVVSENMSGGRTFDVMAGGADISGNDYAHFGLGGQKLNAPQAAEILNEQQKQQLAEYQSQPFMKRVFDTSSPYSPAVKLAMAMPSSAASFSASFTNFIKSPFAKISNIFASIFSSKLTLAAASVPIDPFGVSQYGYPSDSPVFTYDPEHYWMTNCTTDGTTIDWAKPINKQWLDDQQNKDNRNPDTSMPENPRPDPCLLIQATVGAAGGLFDSSLLQSEDLADSGGSNGGSSGATGGATSGYRDPLRDVEKNSGFARHRIDEGADYAGNGNVYAIGSGVVTEVANGSSNQWGNYGGNSVVYKITDGGKANELSVFVAEGCKPISGISVGSQVTSSTPICTMAGESYGIEMGWSQQGSDIPVSWPQYTPAGAPDGSEMDCGLNFSQFMESFGAPGGDPSHSTNPGVIVGNLCSGYPKW